jgi:hypothetical protein
VSIWGGGAAGVTTSQGGGASTALPRITDIADSFILLVWDVVAVSPRSWLGAQSLDWLPTPRPSGSSSSSLPDLRPTATMARLGLVHCLAAVDA